MYYLNFENNICEMDKKLAQPDLSENEKKRLQTKLNRLIENTYKRLTPWQKTLVARHENRPHAFDYIRFLIKDFTPLSGDRVFAEDSAVIGGLGRFKNKTVMVIGTEKGNDTNSRLKHNFGMARPEGYRKAIRLMKLAEKFGFPVLTFVDTAGAFPGVDAEARGQGQAIASCIETGLGLKVPLIATIIGEGGSGGALALSTGNKVFMLENSIYSVISPEGCASILWKDFKYAKQASRALKLTAKDLLKMGIIDEIIPEPMGGAHRFPKEAMSAVGKELEKALAEFESFDEDDLILQRQEKFLAMEYPHQKKKDSATDK